MRRSLGDVAGARARAVALLTRFGVEAPHHVRVEDFAARLGAPIEIAPLEGASAVLLKTQEGPRILLSDRVTDRGAQRFCIAHELGHLLLEHPPISPTDLGAPKAAVVRKSFRICESEANAFAAELLMPTTLVAPLCTAAAPSLDVARRLASDFTVSIPAAAIRITELSGRACVAVLADRGKVRWSVASREFPWRVRRRREIDPASLAGEFFAHGAMSSVTRVVSAAAWCDDVPGVDLIEHAKADPDLGTVLSLLAIPEDVQERLCDAPARNAVAQTSRETPQASIG